MVRIWSQPTPMWRSPSRAANAASGGGVPSRRSSTTKSLPAPCILLKRNAVIAQPWLPSPLAGGICGAASAGGVVASGCAGAGVAGTSTGFCGITSGPLLPQADRTAAQARHIRNGRIRFMLRSISRAMGRAPPAGSRTLPAPWRTQRAPRGITWGCATGRQDLARRYRRAVASAAGEGAAERGGHEARERAQAGKRGKRTLRTRAARAGTTAMRPPPPSARSTPPTPTAGARTPARSPRRPPSPARPSSCRAG